MTAAETTMHESEHLRQELLGLFNYIQRVRKEIASIHRPAESDHQFHSMTDQLDAIIGATETATNTIMAKVEENEQLLDTVRAGTKDKGTQAALAQISDNNMAMIEACSFQDITGQRVSKVLKSIRFVEERVNAIIEVWGKAALEKTEVEASKKTEDQKLLNGPQLSGKGLAQDEIDKLFS